MILLLSYQRKTEDTIKIIVVIVKMFSISLPCYEGFDAFALWPEEESVSYYLV